MTEAAQVGYGPTEEDYYEESEQPGCLKGCALFPIVLALKGSEKLKWFIKTKKRTAILVGLLSLFNPSEFAATIDIRANNPLPPNLNEFVSGIPFINWLSAPVLKGNLRFNLTISNQVTAQERLLLDGENNYRGFRERLTASDHGLDVSFTGQDNYAEKPFQLLLGIAPNRTDQPWKWGAVGNEIPQ